MSEVLNRLEAANGTPKANKPKSTKKPKKASTPRGGKTRSTLSARFKWTKLTCVHWATFGVAFTAILSALLNGYANAQHATVGWAGWLMGLAVPVIVLTLSKVAGEKWKAGQLWVAGCAGGSGVTLLFLSVYHCSTSISLLTGSELWLTLPMSVAIDCGLVACEIALITENG